MLSICTPISFFYFISSDLFSASVAFEAFFSNLYFLSFVVKCTSLGFNHSVNPHTEGYIFASLQRFYFIISPWSRSISLLLVVIILYNLEKQITESKFGHCCIMCKGIFFQLPRYMYMTWNHGFITLILFLIIIWL